jgi:O-antigen chain-terminating methyltransferase
VHHGLRVLRPGGLLILETPNPENIVVGTANFYLDPTHQRPLPPPLLAFLPEYHGFARTKIMRLQESAELAAGKEPTLFDVLGGVSPDYAVMAQKQGDADMLAPFDALWERDYGVKTDTLAMRYEQAHQQSLRSALELARQAVEKSDMLFRQQQQQSEAYKQQLEAQQQQIQAQQQQIQAQQQQIQAFYTSHSWRLTAPLRCLTTNLRSLRFALPIQARGTARHLLLFVLLQMGKHPALERFLRKAAGRFPRLKARLRSFVALRSTESIATPASGNHHGNQAVALTPAARRVYVDLKAAVEESKPEGKS